MGKKYVLVMTTSMIGAGYAGANGVIGREWHAFFKMVMPKAVRTAEEAEDIVRAERAAEEVFRGTGHFPGLGVMTALVRVDGGRAVVCTSRARRGW